MILFRLAACGAFHIDDSDDAAGDVFNAAVSTSFQQNRVPLADEPLHQGIHVRLQQGLAAGHLNHVAAQLTHAPQNILHAHSAAFMKRIRRVAPRTAEIAGRQPDKHTWPSRMGGFPLNRVEDLVDRQHSPGLRSQSLYAPRRTIYFTISEWRPRANPRFTRSPRERRARMPGVSWTTTGSTSIRLTSTRRRRIARSSKSTWTRIAFWTS